jgi:hypothetical protein
VDVAGADQAVLDRLLGLYLPQTGPAPRHDQRRRQRHLADVRVSHGTETSSLRGYRMSMCPLTRPVPEPGYFTALICASGEARTAITSHSSSESWLMA